MIIYFFYERIVLYRSKRVKVRDGVNRVAHQDAFCLLLRNNKQNTAERSAESPEFNAFPPKEPRKNAKLRDEF